MALCAFVIPLEDASGRLGLAPWMKFIGNYRGYFGGIWIYIYIYIYIYIWIMEYYGCLWGFGIKRMG